MKKKFKAFLQATLFITFAPSFCIAQEGSATLPSLDESSVSITHRGNMEISYRIRPENGEWSEYKIKPGEATKISCNDCTTSKFQIIINTEGTEVNYQLNSGQRYITFWNEQKNLWDVNSAQ